MKLVVDTNILFSFFNEKSKAREYATLLSLELYSPNFSLDELAEHKDEILKRFSLSDMQFSLILKILQSVVNFVNIKEYEQHLSKAQDVSPDPDDIDFFALAFKLECNMWSNDSKLNKQPYVEVFSTKDLVEKFGL